MSPQNSCSYLSGVLGIKAGLERNILEKEKIGSLPNVTIVQTALDELGMALTSCNYIWSPQLRSLYEQATKQLKTVIPITSSYEGDNTIGTTIG